MLLLLLMFNCWFGGAVCFIFQSTPKEQIIRLPLLQRQSFHDVRLRYSTTTTTTIRLQQASSSEQSLPTGGSFDSALCVIPPGPSWDTVQRARHVAKDSTYHVWPPAIRLFHPFVDPQHLGDAALEVAKLVETKQIQPFTLRLDQWSVIPHMEVLEAELEALSKPPPPREETEVDKLIQKEEDIGRKRLKKRLAKTNKKNKNTKQQQTPMPPKYNDTSGPRALLEKQRQMYEVFNGPCLVCLEPDEESTQHLLELRSELLKIFGDLYEAYSPTSSVSNHGSFSPSDDAYRPLIPIGRFPTVSSAIEMARKLKGLWDPLEFDVTDLHLVSKQHTKTTTKEPSQHAQPQQQLLLQQQEKDNEFATSMFNPYEQFGCDAMVMLMGQEMEIDEEETSQMVDTLWKEGIPGGGGADSLDSSSCNNLPEKECELEQWLDEEDDDWDEGTVFVLGRTHFFTGEMRMYVGMPAFSMIDKKNRFGGLNGAARRKGHRRRGAGYFQEGDYGHKE